MKARRLSFRLAIRRLRCDRRRTAVIVAVMMVPLTAAVFLSTVRATRSVPEDVQVAAQAGRAQSVVLNQQLVFARGTPAALDEMPDALAAAVGRRVDMTPEVTGSVAVTVGDRQVDAVGYGLLLQDPINRGRFRIQRGHAAQRDDEVVLSTSVADRLDVGVGDTVVLGGEGQELVVTGLTAVRHDTTRRFIVGTPRAVARTVAGRDPENEPLPGQTTAVVSWQLPSRVELDLAARQDGWQVRQREEIVALVGEEAQLNRDETLPWILGGTVLILAELGLILAAVFAVVARSNRRELGLLATAGAGPGFRRRVIVAQGALSGVLAMVAASAVGIVGVVLAAPTLAARSHQIWGTLRIDPRTLAVLTVLGVGTPSLAARVAARGVGTDVVAALQDRPAEVTRRTRTLLSRLGVVLAGVVMVAVGGMGAQASLVILGAVTSVVGVVILGAAASESWLQRIRLPGLLPRLAFRTMTRALGRAAALATV